MIKIYAIENDVNNYQGFIPENEKIWSTGMLYFDGLSKSSIWSPPEVYILEPLLKCGNFFNLISGALVLDEYATEVLQDFLEMSGELLPLFYKGNKYNIFNATHCYDILDDDATKWIYGRSTGAKILIEKYAFRKNRLVETPLFKIPETRKSEILTIEGIKNPEDEFKYRVEQAGLTGLLFNELWRDE